MISTNHIVTDIEKIPSYWVFEYYLSLSEKLTGQDIKIKSIWNTSEKTASMSIYVCKKTRSYKYKDFSSGNSGDKIEIVKQLFNFTYPQAVFKIVDDYNKHADKRAVTLLDIKDKWKVDFIKVRDWYQSDADYWLQYRIGHKMLQTYNVKPIEYFNIVRINNNNTDKNVIKNNYIYGYYDKNNTIIKIYQPRSKKQKFLNVNNYTQGLDQLSYKQPYLVICSSLKDAMCLKSFGYNLDVIAPNSENSLIKPYIIENLKKKYKSVITFFDNDEAGKNAIDKYKSVYNINGFYLPICKDISDAVSQNNFMDIHASLKPLLIKTLKT